MCVDSASFVTAVMYAWFDNLFCVSGTMILIMLNGCFWSGKNEVHGLVTKKPKRVAG